MIYLNVLCIAISGFCTGWSSTNGGKAINALACLLNLAIVINHVAKHSI